MYQVGIDLGGTKIEGILVDVCGATHFRYRIPTEQENGYDHILHNIKEVYDTVTSKAGGGGIAHSVGIGVPGAVSPEDGTLMNSNTLCLNRRHVKKDLESLLNVNVAIENDANCFALAEALKGAGMGNDLVFGVIMGTGCGGGIVYKGGIVRGRQSIAGEWGHMSIDPGGPACYCGSSGCVETFISGGGLERMYKNLFAQEITLPVIVDRYRDGDDNCGKFMKHFFARFGRSMANLINILDPDIIVLGGGVSNVDELYTDGIEEVRKCVMNNTPKPHIVKNRLGDSAGVIGAAIIGGTEYTRQRDGET